MAKHYSLSYSTFADEFKAALEAYYVDGATIESAGGQTIVFECPAVCDKVIKIAAANSGVYAYIGDASETMTQFSFSYNGSSTTYNLILADAFILVEPVLEGNHSSSALIAKLTNGRYMVAGGHWGSISNVSYASKNKCCFTDTMVLNPIRMVAPYAGNFKSNSKFCLFPSYVANDKEVELNSDGTFASIPGLWLAPTTGAPVVGGNYYLSKSGLYGLEAEGCYCTCQKYVELEME